LKKKKSKKKAPRKKKTIKRKKVVKRAKRRKVKGAPENKMLKRNFESKTDQVVQEFLDEDEEQMGFDFGDDHGFIDEDFDDMEYGQGPSGENDY